MIVRETLIRLFSQSIYLNINPTIVVRRSSKKDPFSNHISDINIIILGLVSGTQVKVIHDYGFVPYSLFLDNIPNIIARLISSIFIHSGIAHLAVNILALIYIGPYSERSVGITRCVVIYIGGGRSVVS